VNGDPFAQMTRALCGAPPATPPPLTPWQRLEFVAGLLRAFDDPVAQDWASALEHFARHGGSLEAHLGLKLASGGCHQRPAKKQAKARRDQSIRELASTLDCGAHKLASLIRRGDARVLILMQDCQGMPTSKAQIARILKERAPPHQAPAI
jgi:hypothetical protein